MKRIAVITGAASGIGAALARGLAKEQYDLVLVGRNVDALSATAEDIISQTPQCNVQCKSADLTNLDDRSTVFSAVASAGVNDILLINNAGISHFGTLASTKTLASRSFSQPMSSRQWHLRAYLWRGQKKETNASPS